MVLRNMTTQSDHDARTPEERLLSKKRLGSFYLDEVRALIAERDNALRLAGSDYEECATERDIARGRAEAAEAEVRRLTEGLRHPRKLESAALELAGAAESVERGVMSNGLAQKRETLRWHIANLRRIIERDRVTPTRR